ncbi:MAG: hypothetical protein UV57_C0058G0001 [Parcubacteria group bacterium GW2011_GWD2_43_10]|uniref:Uncharacterized protein n=1 Tax=Candidatus Veblenbacteria bacterium RIFOXYA2_FULL_43_9 TaxID=1802425 RepID=A0A1G2Q477_9BACT|nr:MAG: hypothetical protein UV57_C0058G0001 [Parcubacteria group bacterium GW2011_GWD2_43_10]OHA55390.1 MAG: hypothetical protein A2226_03200 [Candidatus Veblenbacteria bacterium RIFOXYA2_FULL_43_9]
MARERTINHNSITQTNSKENQMKLVANSDTAGNPTVALRWCLVPEEIAYLKDKKIPNPHILLLVVNDRRCVDRQLLPISDLMTYISFNHLGDNTVWATIVWHDEGLRKLREFYISKGKYGYNNGFYNRETDTLEDTDGYGLDSIVINISADFFAPEPAEWEKKWVNLLFETKPKDQCQFRKRRILAYTLQPILILFEIFIKISSRLLAALFFTVIRTRTKVNFVPIIHPFKNDTEDIYYESLRHGRNIYLRNKDNTEREDYAIAGVLFHPITVIVLSAILLMIDLAGTKIFLGWWSYLVGSLVVGVSIIVLVLIISVLGEVVKWLAGNIKSWRKKTSKDRRLEKARRQKAKYAQEAKAKKLAEEAKERAIQTNLDRLNKEFALISCDSGPLVPKLEALPKEKRTIHLRFLDLKARVCKPFAG